MSEKILLEGSSAMQNFHSFQHCFGLFLCLFTISDSNRLSAACNCPSPDPSVCEEQPNAPPYSPCTLIDSANSYVMRYSVNGVQGAMTFIGNTLGLAKAVCENEPGTAGFVVGSIGAFTTIDPTEVVGSYESLTTGDGSPAGTTLDWTKNNSSAVLDLPSGILILHAELVWSGSFGYFCADGAVGVNPDCVLDFASGPINFTTPDGVLHLVTADPTTALSSLNPSPTVQPYYCAGNYTRSQDVTAILTLLAAGSSGSNGTYTVGGVPATISPYENNSNAAGWTLAIIYQDPSSVFVNNMTLFLGAQQGSRATVVEPAAVNGFYAQTQPGLISARLLVSAIEGDADLAGDQMFFGPTTSNLSALSGPNNLVDNFFGSQINDDNGNLIDTTGTYCTFNHDPVTEVLVPNGRQGYDITNVDCSSTITSGQTTAFALGTSTGDGDDYTINALGIQISVVAPVIVPIKEVNGSLSIDAEVGDTVTFSISMENTGGLAAYDVNFQDTLEQGLAFVPGSLTLNNVSMPNADPAVGVDIGTLDVNGTSIVAFNATIVSPATSGNILTNYGTSSFYYSPGPTPIETTNNSNLAVINLADFPTSPTDFNGTVNTCNFLNKKNYSLSSSWDPLPYATIESYEIYDNGYLVATIPAAGPYVFDTCLSSRGDGSDFSISAVYMNGVITTPVNITILN